MTNIFSFLNKIKLTQDLSGFKYFENFLIATISTVLGVRFFLKLSGYPQIGGGGFHIAHMLWGGLILLGCLLTLFLFMDRRVKGLTAIFGGIGFGLFIDELGKFITSDNNYFFQPTVALMYLFLILLFLLLHALKNHLTISKEEYLANTLDLFRNSLVHGLTKTEKDEAMLYLKEAKAPFKFQELYRVTKTAEVERQEIFTTLQNIKETLAVKANNLLATKIFQIGVITVVEIQALASFVILGVAVLYFSNVFPEHVKANIVLNFDFASTAALISAFMSGSLAIIGVFMFMRSRQLAFSFIRYSLFISIFIVQIFIFWLDQFSGLVGLGFNIVALETVNEILAKQKE